MGYYNIVSFLFIGDCQDTSEIFVVHVTCHNDNKAYCIPILNSLLSKRSKFWLVVCCFRPLSFWKLEFSDLQISILCYKINNALYWA